jgi:hypothetical protein
MGRLPAILLTLVILLTPGCLWCPHWHRHCCKPATPVVEVAPAALRTP